MDDHAIARHLARQVADGTAPCPFVSALNAYGLDVTPVGEAEALRAVVRRLVEIVDVDPADLFDLRSWIFAAGAGLTICDRDDGWQAAIGAVNGGVLAPSLPDTEAS